MMPDRRLGKQVNTGEIAIQFNTANFPDNVYQISHC